MTAGGARAKRTAKAVRAMAPVQPERALSRNGEHPMPPILPLHCAVEAKNWSHHRISSERPEIRLKTLNRWTRSCGRASVLTPPRPANHGIPPAPTEALSDASRISPSWFRAQPPSSSLWARRKFGKARPKASPGLGGVPESPPPAPVRLPFKTDFVVDTTTPLPDEGHRASGPRAYDDPLAIDLLHCLAQANWCGPRPAHEDEERISYPQRFPESPPITRCPRPVETYPKTKTTPANEVRDTQPMRPTMPKASVDRRGIRRKSIRMSAEVASICSSRQSFSSPTAKTNLPRKSNGGARHALSRRNIIGGPPKHQPNPQDGSSCQKWLGGASLK